MKKNMKNQKIYFLKKIILLIYNIFFIYIIFINKYFQLYKIPKISVFLPIYNKEKYLYRSIGSIQNQTLKDIEIVAINDGSTDKSLKILKKLAKNDTRIKIFNNDRNHGLLYSRAMGILNSSGEYLMNLDPDDKYEGNDNLEILYKIIKKSNLNYIIYLLKKISSNKLQYKIFKLKNKLQRKFNPPIITNKLIKKNLFLKAFKKFEKYIYSHKWNYCEDNIWNKIIKILSKSCMKVNRFIYIYERNRDSLMAKKINIIKKKNIIYRFKMLLELSNLNQFNINKYIKLFKDINKKSYYYNYYILKDYEIKHMLLHISMKLLKFYSNKDNTIFEVIKDYINKMSNKKIIIFKEQYKSNIDNYITYLPIYNIIKENYKKIIISINQNNQNQIIDIIDYIFPDDILILFDNIILNPNITMLLNKFTTNKKILILTQNEYIKYNNIENIIFNNINNYKLFIFYNYSYKNIKNIKKYNEVYIFPKFIFDVSNYINYKKNYKNNLLILFNKNKFKYLKKIIRNNISKYFQKVIFYDCQNITKIKKLIKIINKTQIIFTDNFFILKLSVITFTSSIILTNKEILKNQNIKLIEQLDYIKLIYNINELEKNVLNLKNKKNIFNSKFDYNNFLLFKNELK